MKICVWMRSSHVKEGMHKLAPTLMLFIRGGCGNHQLLFVGS
jgi:hypothetical protein